MLDGISFEETGKPAVVVATTNFVQLATSIKQSMNLAGLPLVVVPHPLGNRVVAGEKAALVAADIVKAVTQSWLLPAGHTLEEVTLTTAPR
jgi:hypothetical protein